MAHLYRRMGLELVRASSYTCCRGVIQAINGEIEAHSHRPDQGVGRVRLGSRGANHDDSHES